MDRLLASIIKYAPFRLLDGPVKLDGVRLYRNVELGVDGAQKVLRNSFHRKTGRLQERAAGSRSPGPVGRIGPGGSPVMVCPVIKGAVRSVGFFL